jgi:hypothetical protein
MVQNVTESVIALLMEHGGHHADLMLSDKDDPKCVADARQTEKEHVAKWTARWNRSN